MFFSSVPSILASIFGQRNEKEIRERGIHDPIRVAAVLLNSKGATWVKIFASGGIFFKMNLPSLFSPCRKGRKRNMIRPDDLRLFSIIDSQTAFRGDVVLIGFPFDEGCVRNGGRPGAALAPAAFRSFLKGMGTVVNPEFSTIAHDGTHHVGLKLPVVSDYGDIEGATLEGAHQQLEEVVLHVLRLGKIPFVVGGGNDQSAANGRALLTFIAGTEERESTRARTGFVDVGVVNIDAHLDVRPRIDGRVHSGTPFRELLEDERLDPRRFVEFAAQGHCCAEAHAHFVRTRGGTIEWFSNISNDPVGHFRRVLKEVLKENVFVSFDIDSVQSADCPGVSAPSSFGLRAFDAVQICYEAGLSPNVKVIDVSELNPAVEGYRSPRLAVLMFYYFLLGVARRIHASKL